MTSKDGLYTYYRQLEEKFSYRIYICNEVYKALIERNEPQVELQFSPSGRYLHVVMDLFARGFNVDIKSEFNTTKDDLGQVTECTHSLSYLVTKNAGKCKIMPHFFSPIKDKGNGIISQEYAESYIVEVWHWLGHNKSLEEILEYAFSNFPKEKEKPQIPEELKEIEKFINWVKCSTFGYESKDKWFATVLDTDEYNRRYKELFGSSYEDFLSIYLAGSIYYPEDPYDNLFKCQNCNHVWAQPSRCGPIALCPSSKCEGLFSVANTYKVIRDRPEDRMESIS